MSETQAVFDYNPGHVGAIESAMSTDRLERYLAECGGDKEKALRRYARNSLLSEALYIPLQGVEIVLRNAFHKQLLKTFGPQWFEEIDQQNCLNPENEAATPPALLKLRDARLFLKQKGKPETAPAVTAELSFGFWVALSSRRYQGTLWNPCLFRPFKGLGMARGVIFLRLDHIRSLRNRVAHHEPILNRDLPDDFAKIIETIRWICGASADWIQKTSCFSQRWAAQ